MKDAKYYMLAVVIWIVIAVRMAAGCGRGWGMSNYRNNLDVGVNNIGYTIVRLAPIIAPAPALATLLDATDYAMYAWFVVVGVELTGYAIGEQSVKAIRLGVFTLKNLVAALVVYGLVIEGLMLGYKVLPAWAEWYAGEIDLSHAIQALVGVLYPAFTLAGAILFAFHEHLEEVQAERDYNRTVAQTVGEQDATDDREYKRQEREIELEAKRAKALLDAKIEEQKALAAIRIKEQKSLAKSPKSDSGRDSKRDSRIKNPIDYERIVIDYFTDNPLTPQREAAEATGISQAKISKTLKDLESRKIIHRNGNGVEVL
jgi:hypothetical protein